MSPEEAEKYFSSGKTYEVMDAYNQDDVNPLETQESDEAERFTV